jgi:hypothetical protein
LINWERDLKEEICNLKAAALGGLSDKSCLSTRERVEPLGDVLSPDSAGTRNAGLVFNPTEQLFATCAHFC